MALTMKDIKVRQGIVKVGGTVNIGNFSNVQPEFGLSFDIQPGQDPNEAQRVVAENQMMLFSEHVQNIVATLGE